MSGEWEDVRLGDLSEVITKGTTPTSLGFRFTDTGINYVKSESVTFDGWIDSSKFARIDAKTHTALKRSQLKEGDVLFSMAGIYIGKTAVVPKDILPANTNQAVGIVRLDQTRAHPRFIDYFLRNPSYNLFLNNLVSQSAQPNLNLTEIRNLPIRLPPLPEQKAIAAVLGALDDKIELNRRMNATLEAMARALFQSWFVDFDPVRAKLDGRKPTGLDAATAALFPDKFHESTLGPIPQGWTATTLGDACTQGGGNIQTGPFGTQLHASDYVDDGIPSIMPSDLRDNRIDTSSVARIRGQDAERLSVYRVQSGDVVYSRRGDVERRSLIRCAEDGWLCGTGCLRVRFGPRGINPFFGASHLGTLESRAWVVRHAVGATMPNLNTSILGALPMQVPPPALQARFAEIVGPWDEQGTRSLEQSRTLSTLRDTLLPRLLSGELTTKPLGRPQPK